jgi:hypothetical protein
MFYHLELIKFIKSDIQGIHLQKQGLNKPFWGITCYLSFINYYFGTQVISNISYIYRERETVVKTFTLQSI